MLLLVTKYAVQAVADLVSLGSHDTSAAAVLRATNDTSVGTSFCGNQTVATSARRNGGDVAMEIISNTLQLLAAICLLCVASYTKLTGRCRKQYGVTFSERVFSCMALTVLQSSAFFMSAAGDFNSTKLSHNTCVAQGFLFQFAVSGLFCELAAISYMGYRSLTQHLSLDEIYRKERVRVFSLVYGTAFLFALAPTLLFVIDPEIPVFSQNDVSVMCYMSDCTGALLAFVFPLFLGSAAYCVVACVKILCLVTRAFRHTYTNKVCLPRLTLFL